MNDAIQDAKDHAIEAYPAESAGFVVKEGDADRYLRATNLSLSKNHFRIGRDEYARVSDEHELVGIVHSHPNGLCQPSQADLVAIEGTATPWLIISYNPGVGGDDPRIDAKWFRPTGFRLPLSGRTFAHGVVDCYTLIRDHYAWELGIDIPDFERRDDWWDTPDNLYVDNFAKAGFVEIPYPPKGNDVLLLHIQTPPEKPCHAGIYLDGNVILHHLPNRLSGKDVYGGYYQRHTVKVLRHKSLC